MSDTGTFATPQSGQTATRLHPDRQREFLTWFKDIFCRACRARRIPFDVRNDEDKANYIEILNIVLDAPILLPAERAMVEQHLLRAPWPENKRVLGIMASDFYPEGQKFTDSVLAVLMQRAFEEGAASERAKRIAKPVAMQESSAQFEALRQQIIELGKKSLEQGATISELQDKLRRTERELLLYKPKTAL